MTTFRFTHAVEVAVSPEVAWRVVADYARDAEWREGVVMEHEPVGLVREGTRTVERLRAFGAEHVVVATIHGVEPGRAFSFRSVEAEMPVRGTRRVAPSPGGARVEVELEVELGGLYALFSAPFGYLFRRRLARDLARLADELRRDASAVPDTRSGCGDASIPCAAQAATPQ